MAVRTTGWLIAFALAIVPHLFATLAGRSDLVPPVFLGLLARISGAHVTVVGKPADGALLLANHVSWLDVLALAGASRTTFVAHSGLSMNPFLKWFCDQNDTVFITRDRRRTVGQQVRQVLSHLGHRRLTIFPESTTGDGRTMLPFRSSLLSAVERLPDDIPVQPVALDYADAPAIAWHGSEHGLRNLVRIFARTSPIGLTIRFLEPLHGHELADRKAMASAAQSRIRAALDG